MPETTTISLPADLIQELTRRGAERGLDAAGYIAWLVRTHGGVPTRATRPPSPRGSVVVSTASRHYCVRAADGLLKGLGDLVRGLVPARRAHLVADDGLPRALVELASGSLAAAGFAVSVSRVSATEAGKSLEAAANILQELLASKHERTDPVVTLGGGIVTDLGGFVAATYRRGVPVVHCPTTLLAMVDAAVGGKTGVNLALPTVGGTSGAGGGAGGGGLAKNMVGAFWQPHLVVCDTDVLRTLPSRQLRAGMAECIKHALLSAGLPEGGGRDSGLWAWTLGNLEACLRLDGAVMSELIARNVSVKAGVVSSDEREEAPSATGGRALLNLGHTFAHAIETMEGLGVEVGGEGDADRAAGRSNDAFMLHHGEAVGLGLIAAAAASARLGMLPESDAEIVRGVVARAGLPTRVRGLPADDALIERMSHDKKSVGGALRLILLKSLGEAVVVENPAAEVVRAGWAAVRG